MLEGSVAGEIGRVLITDHIFGEVTTYLRRNVVVYRNRGASGIFSFDRVFDAVRNINRLETIP
jgi:predicted nucleic acid-binding protein